MNKRSLGISKLCAQYGATFEKSRRSGHFKIRLNGRVIAASGSPKDRDTSLWRLKRDLQSAAGTAPPPRPVL